MILINLLLITNKNQFRIDKVKENIKDTTQFCNFMLKSEEVNPIIKGLSICFTLISIGFIISFTPFYVIANKLNKF